MRRISSPCKEIAIAVALCLPSYGLAQGTGAANSKPTRSVGVLQAGQNRSARTRTVLLEDWTYGDATGQRWLDTANQPFSASYRDSYSYSNAVVQVDYATTSTGFEGTLRASNLKPNFAYQLKMWSLDHPDNERLGLIGRWCQYEWDGTWWSNGQVLNDKGDGSSPNPNDLLFFARCDVVDKDSPTGRRYLFYGILIFGYIVTDGEGNASAHFSTGNSYHVLWKESQRARAEDDGPRLAHTFDPDPALHPAYDSDYGENTVAVFGEWERLPPGAFQPPPGNYSGSFVLTEESFHGDGGDYAGVWTNVMGGTINFRVLPRRTLTVGSTPVGDVLITGNPPEAGGTTSYVTEVGDRTRVTLTAPAAVAGTPVNYRFQRWLLNGAPKPNGRGTLSFTVTADTTAEAVYGQPALHVTFPTEPGIALARGSTYVVSWTSENLPSNERVKIELCDSVGGSWTLAASVSNRGQWKWKVGKWQADVPPVYPDGGGYRIRVSASGGVLAESSDTFEIVTYASGRTPGIAPE